MKKMIPLMVFLVGCASTSVQTGAFKTISAVDLAAKASYGGYIVAADKNLVATNDIPHITVMYRQLESDCVVAALTASSGTNALAPVNLQQELSSLTTAIANIQPLTK